MTLLKCETCGGSLEVDAGNDSATCKFCGSTYSRDTVQKMIVEYRGKVQIEGRSFEELLERGNTFLDLREWKSARQVFGELSQLYPNRHEGWWGMVMADAKGNVQNIAAMVPRELECTKYYEAALQFAPAEKAREIRELYAPVLSAREAYLQRQEAMKKRSFATKLVGTILLVSVSALYVCMALFHISANYQDFVNVMALDDSIWENLKGLYLFAFFPGTIYVVVISILLAVLFRGDSFGYYRLLSTAMLVFSAFILMRAEVALNGGDAGTSDQVITFVVMAILCSLSMLPGLVLSKILSKATG